MNASAKSERPALSDEEASTRLKEAHSYVQYYTAWSAGAGLVPIPLVDSVLVMGVQLQMLRKVSGVYGVEFREDLAKKVIAVLLGGVVPGVLSGGIGSLLRGIPGVGLVVGVVAMPALSAAATYAIGRVFAEHFDLGGTFLDFDPEEVRGYFRNLYEGAAAAAKK